jgi:hypothetical protein
MTRADRRSENVAELTDQIPKNPKSNMPVRNRQQRIVSSAAMLGFSALVVLRIPQFSHLHFEQTNGHPIGERR